jgi:hypothetical protein
VGQAIILTDFLWGDIFKDQEEEEGSVILGLGLRSER